MHAAPPVQMPCGRSARWALGATLLAACACASLGGWLAERAGIAGLPLAAVVLGAALLAAARVGPRLARAPQRRLAWDGSTWRLDGAAGWPDVTMDCGGWMLLRWRGEDARAHWLPFQPDACGASAHLARAALRAHGGRTQVAAQPPVERHG
ncbi:MAG: hypothetical protein AMXMBFR78_32910 [Rubrivivax sp.]|jgi:hypothetical protein